ncbi:MAG: MGMT family protein [Candidatus Odinarchaeota archaeon]
MPVSFSQNVRELIKQIPYGRVATYGQIAAFAGNPRAARQVAWILHSCSKKDNLPWHRVINSKGRISLPYGGGYETQKKLLEIEGINFKENDFINLNIYLWEFK